VTARSRRVVFPGLQYRPAKFLIPTGGCGLRNLSLPVCPCVVWQQSSWQAEALDDTRLLVCKAATLHAEPSHAPLNPLALGAFVLTTNALPLCRIGNHAMCAPEKGHAHVHRGPLDTSPRCEICPCRASLSSCIPSSPPRPLPYRPPSDPSYAAVMARCTRTPRCLEFKRTSFRPATASDLATVSSGSVRISSMWHGFDM